MARWIKTNDTAETVQPQGKYFELNELQAMVGGYIECVNLPGLGEHKVMVVNEEGKLDGLPVNYNATLLARMSGLDDVIVGNVVIVEEEGEHLK